MPRQIDFFDPLRDLRAFIASCEGRAYAGIGSRETPDDICLLMTAIAKRLEAEGLMLRSGGAKGADDAFEEGADNIKRIFLPWEGFNGRASGRNFTVVPFVGTAHRIASEHHPAWWCLSEGSMKLLIRNTPQVLGAACNDPSAFVLCWTPDGSIGKTTSKTGGTGQAIRIAYAYGVPVFNLRRDDHREAWERFVELR